MIKGKGSWGGRTKDGAFGLVTNKDREGETLTDLLMFGHSSVELSSRSFQRVHGAVQPPAEPC